MQSSDQDTFNCALSFPRHLVCVCVCVWRWGEGGGTNWTRISCILVVWASWRFFHLPQPGYCETPPGMITGRCSWELQGCRFLSTRRKEILFFLGLSAFLNITQPSVRFDRIMWFLFVCRSVCFWFGILCRYLGLICESPLWFLFPELEDTLWIDVDDKSQKQAVKALFYSTRLFQPELPFSEMLTQHVCICKHVNYTQVAVFILVALLANAFPHLNVTPPILFISCIYGTGSKWYGR